MPKVETAHVRIESHSLEPVYLLQDVLRQLRAMIDLLTDFADDERYSRVEVVRIHKNGVLESDLRLIAIQEVTRQQRGQPILRRVVKPNGKPLRRLENVYDSLTAPRVKRKPDTEGLVALSECVSRLKQDVARITTSKREIVLESSLLPRIKTSLGPTFRAMGSEMGVLDRLNTQSDVWTFTLYSDVEPRKVKCNFREELYPQVHAAHRQMVRVYGNKVYSTNAPWPIQIDVTEIEVIDPAPEGAWDSLIDEMSAAWLLAPEEERMQVTEVYA